MTHLDAINEDAAWLYAISRATPAKRWWEAEPWHPAVGRALHIDRQEKGGVFALGPFRLAKVDGAHAILAAYPAPRILGPVDEDWLGIEQVVAWDPRTDTATVLGDSSPQLVGRLSDETPRIYASARTFFADWAMARAAFFTRWVQFRRGEWAHGATEFDFAPGAFAIGPIDAIPWRPSLMPQYIKAVDVDPSRLNKAMMRAARLPRAHAASLRDVA